MDVNNAEVDDEMDEKERGIETLALNDHQIKQLCDENNKLKVDNKGRVEDTSTVYPSSGREKSDKTSGQ